MDSASDADVKPGGPGEDPPPVQPLGLSAPSNGGLRVLLPVALGLLALDLITKIWAVSALDDGRRIDLVWTLRFNLVRNEGAAFSLGTSITPIIAVASLGVAIAVVYVGRRIERPSVLAALGLVLGGAVGNVVDRIFREGDGFLRGAVVDFIDLQWWPVFNVADMGIVIGGLLLVFLLSEPSEPTEPTEPSGPSGAEPTEPTDPGP